jgi:hypothetical protein
VSGLIQTLERKLDHTDNSTTLFHRDPFFRLSAEKNDFFTFLYLVFFVDDIFLFPIHCPEWRLQSLYLFQAPINSSQPAHYILVSASWSRFDEFVSAVIYKQNFDHTTFDFATVVFEAFKQL